MNRAEELLKTWEMNRKKVEERDQQAKAKGILKGRYIREPYADGYSYYEIIRENKNTVRIRVIKNIGDDWELPYFGEETTVDKSYAIGNIRNRDYMNEIFGQKS